VCTVKSPSIEEDARLSVVENTGHIGLALEVTLPVLVPQCAAPFWCEQPAAEL